MGDVLLLVVFVVGSGGLSWAIRWDAGRAEAKRRRREFRRDLRFASVQFIADFGPFQDAINRTARALAEVTERGAFRWTVEPEPRKGYTPAAASQWFDEAAGFKLEDWQRVWGNRWVSYGGAGRPDPLLWEGDQA